MYWIILSFITYQFHLILQTLGLGYEQEGTMVPVRIRVVQYHAYLSLSLSVQVPHTAKWHRKQIILRQVSSWSLNSIFSQVDTTVFTIYISKPDDFSYFSLNFCLDRCREGYSFFSSLFSFQNLCVTLCLNSQKDCARPRREKKRNNFESWRWEKILGDESWRWEFELWNFRWVGERKE